MSRLITGYVVSDRPDKSIIVREGVRKTHPIYRKQYSRSRKFMAHDGQNQAKIGDLVVIRESRPLSAHKRYELDRIVERSHEGFVEADTVADVPLEEIGEKTQPQAAPTDVENKKPAKKTSTKSGKAKGSEK